MKNQIQKTAAVTRKNTSWKEIIGAVCAYALVIAYMLMFPAISAAVSTAEDTAEARMMMPAFVREANAAETVNALTAVMSGKAEATPERVHEYDTNVTAVEAAQAFDLYLMGLTDREIAASTGTCVQAVRDWRTANRLLPGAPMHSTEYLLTKAAIRENSITGE